MSRKLKTTLTGIALTAVGTYVGILVYNSSAGMYLRQQVARITPSVGGGGTGGASDGSILI